ncbi:hypothetical protein [Caballeronia glebae]|uniref:Uncharacterized protein n=1 Tax=Caballeronia glebae TaxID=1777143 RepID=A0A158CER5_9BURK|nr:hypothetical protein [Caballeronia glebae]SAK80386.1 hypothetical protein AWB82_05284 [Caballeronia glebae]
MKSLQVTVDAQGNAVVSHSMPIGEHCRSRARRLASLIDTLAAPGGMERLGEFAEPFKREMFTLMQSLAEEQIPNLEALEKHMAQTYYERGVRAAIEHRQKEEAIKSPQPLPVAQGH